MIQVVSTNFKNTFSFQIRKIIRTLKNAFARDLTCKSFIFFIFITLTNISLAQVKFCAVGDILLDRAVRRIINENDIFYPFDEVKEIISANDIAFYNNEFPVCDSIDGYAINKKYSFRAEPYFIESIKDAGFNIASVANNHTIDYSKKGLIRTIEILNESGIYTIGGGKNQTEAFAPLMIEKNGETFAFFANLEFLLEGTSFNQNRPYPAYAQIERLCGQIEKYNSIVDFVVVSFHWGRESVTTPTSKQVEFAHKVVDAGADLVIGHHPHVLQGIETYRDKIILYSLGNFVFDNSKPLQKQSAIFQCTFEDGVIKNPHLIPIKIENNRPVIAKIKDAEETFNQIKKISKGFNSIFEIKDKIIKIKSNYKKTINEFYVKNLKFDFYQDSIFVFDDSFFEYSYSMPDTNYVFVDVCMLPKDSLIYFYSILKNKQTSKTQIAIFVFSTKKFAFATPSLDAHNFFDAWKIDILDVDSDGVEELIVGVNKSTRYFDEKENRIFVFNIDGTYIYPKWLGSKIGNPIVDFKIDKVKNKLILLESFEKEGLNKAFECSWNGFGFDLDSILFELDTNQNTKTFFILRDFAFKNI